MCAADAKVWTTARLRLCPLTSADAGALHAITDRVVTDAIDFLPDDFTEEDARVFIRGSDGDVAYGAWRRDGGALIGVVGTHPSPNGDEIEIGYWIATRFAGQGYASEAAAGVIGGLRAADPGRAIFAECRPENRASWRVLEKLGFVPTGADGKRAGRKKLMLK